MVVPAKPDYGFCDGLCLAGSHPYWNRGFFAGNASRCSALPNFFYLQPFFLLLSVMGIRETGALFLTLMKRNSGFHEKDLLVMTGVLAGILLLISSLKIFQHIYPQRLSREPLHRVHDFVQNHDFRSPAALWSAHDGSVGSGGSAGTFVGHTNRLPRRSAPRSLQKHDFQLRAGARSVQILTCVY